MRLACAHHHVGRTNPCSMLRPVVGQKLSPDLVWWLRSLLELIGSGHGLEHIFDSPLSGVRAGWPSWRWPRTRSPPRTGTAWVTRPGRTGPGPAAAGRPPGRPVAQGTGRGWMPAAPPGPNRTGEVGSTAAWLRGRLRLGAGAATSAVRTARALFRGPLAATAEALTDGTISAAHAAVLAPAPRTYPTMSPPMPNRCSWRRRVGWTHPGCAGSSATSSWSPTPTAPTPRPSDATSGEGCGWPRPWTAWSRWTGCWGLRPARPSWPPWNH